MLHDQPLVEMHLLEYAALAAAPFLIGAVQRCLQGLQLTLGKRPAPLVAADWQPGQRALTGSETVSKDCVSCAAEAFGSRSH